MTSFYCQYASEGELDKLGLINEYEKDALSFEETLKGGVEECRCWGLREEESRQISSNLDGVDVRNEVLQLINKTQEQCGQ